MASNKKKSIVSRSPDESLSLNKNGESLTRGETPSTHAKNGRNQWSSWTTLKIQMGVQNVS